MKMKIFENQFTREQVICRDLKQVQLIDGEEYLRVQKYLGGGSNAGEQLRQREFLVRKNALKQVQTH